MMPVPNESMANEAQRGLDWRKEYGRGGTAVGVARARDIVNRRDLSMDTVGRMSSFFARHEVDKEGQGWSPGEDGYPSAGRIAWALWGGDPGRAWARALMDDDDENNRGGRRMADRTQDRQVCTDDAFEVRAAPDGDGLTIAGYIARFNERTQISDFLGDYVERIAPGAFARTLAERGAGRIKMQFNHGHDSTFGSLPIGVWTSLRETRQGLWGEGRIHDNWHTLPIRAALESGALDGMSFRFKAISEEWRQGDGADERTLTEVALFEAGPVVNPAYEGTTVGVRARALDLLRGQCAHDDDDIAPCATLDEQRAAAVPVDGTEPTRAEADPPVGITRREMRIQALTRTGAMIPDDPDRGVA